MELLVVISIVALLISMLLPALSSARESASMLQCLVHLRQISQASQAYVEDNKGYYAHYYAYQPPNYTTYTTWVTQITRYMGVSSANIGRPGVAEPARSANPFNAYRCPTIQRSMGTFFERYDVINQRTDYAWNSQLGRVNSGGSSVIRQKR